MIDKEYAQSLGKRLIVLSRKVGNKRKLATAAGLGEPQLYRYIKGDNVPATSVVVDLAYAADISFEWLATGKGKMEKTVTTDSSLTFNKLVDTITAIEDTANEKQIKLSTKQKVNIINLIYEQTDNFTNQMQADSMIKKLVEIAG